MKLRAPDSIRIYAEERVCECADGAAGQANATAWTEQKGDCLLVKAAGKDALRYLRLYWRFSGDEARAERVKVLGDEWERGYGAMEWRGIVPERCMPWVCMVSDGSDAVENASGRFTECFGVRARPAALCFWQYDSHGLTLWLDVRCGGSGVRLGERVLDACEIVFGEYRDVSAFWAIRAFYGRLCDDALTTDHKVYGSNNWYYAYGKSSHEEILSDARLVAGLCEGLANRPYMVIDDGWQINPCDAPWDGGNARFPDMRALAEGVKALNVRPGIWIRYLVDEKRQAAGVRPEHRLMRDANYLDPSHPDVLARVARDTRRIVEEWGFQLIKHDFSTFDVFGHWGFQRPTTLTDDGWHFYDQTKTGAEIMIGFYRAIREAAGPQTVLIGCNVIGHLAAGLVHLNRTGDDTSGREWERTRKMGVNTLAFRMMHDKNFYAADADCLGVTGAIDWTLNRRWLEALAASGTPMFTSIKPGVLSGAQAEEVRAAFARASLQRDALEPLDWMETTCPARWLLNGEAVSFDWDPADGVDSFRP